ncbi:hypothetical protein [Melittangium boletus]|uniref:hypothetical protein n=1 Tax=Melittangium boletus TaxID=83453 RepID=UPI003DA4EA5F
METRSFLPLLLLLIGSGCKQTPARDPSTLPLQDCLEDRACFLARSEVCAPATVLVREQVTVAGARVRTVTRHEVVGRVQGRCHLRLTRVEPPPLPIHEDVDPFMPGVEPVEPPTAEQQALDARSPSRLQCLYALEQSSGALRRRLDGQPTPEDLEPCYPGDGRCGRVPLLSPPCALGDCLLGRWTYSCEARGGRDIFACEGTRGSDASPRDAGCASWCGADGREQLDCRKPRTVRDGGMSDP